MERHCSIETTLSIASKRSICVSTEILLLLRKVGLERKIFGNGRGRFGRTGPTVKGDHLGSLTILTKKFPQIYFSTEISETFGMMESTLCPILDA